MEAIWWLLNLVFPSPISCVSYGLAGDYRGFPTQSRVRIYTNLDEMMTIWNLSLVTILSCPLMLILIMCNLLQMEC